MKDIIIEINQVSKSYKNISVIKDLSIVFQKGKSYGIMGHNGSGKSVVLKLIAGYAFADSGEIIVDGKTIKKDVDFIQNAGVVINAPEFINSLSGLKNLMYLADINNKIDIIEIEAIMKKMGIYDSRNKKVSTYSQGMKQRLRIAQAIMENPDILILDEPMNALDKSGISLVKEILNDHVKQGKTLIFTSHQKDDFIDLADTVLEIDNGTLIEVDVA